MGDYRNLEVWQKAKKLAVHAYRKTGRFPSSEQFGLTAQIRRAAVSVPSNIAEGHGRQTSRERVQFLSIARGSLFELETQVLIGAELGYLSGRQAEIIVDAVNEIGRQMNALIAHYRRRVVRRPVRSHRDEAKAGRAATRTLHE